MYYQILFVFSYYFLYCLDCFFSSEDVLNCIEVEKGSYNMTPAKILLRNLGNKGFRASHLVQWFETMGLQKALIWLKTEGNKTYNTYYLSLHENFILKFPFQCIFFVY